MQTKPCTVNLTHLTGSEQVAGVDGSKWFSGQACCQLSCLLSAMIRQHNVLLSWTVIERDHSEIKPHSTPTLNLTE